MIIIVEHDLDIFFGSSVLQMSRQNSAIKLASKIR